MIFNVAELDVWGNAEDGFDINNIYRTDNYIDVKDTEVETLTEALKKWYNLPAFTVDGDDEYTLFLEDECTVEPLLYLYRENSPTESILERIE